MKYFRESRSRDRIVGYFFAFWLRITSFPSLELMRALGRFFGRLAYCSNVRQTRIARRNVELVYREKSSEQREQLVKSIMEEFGALLCEMGHVWCRPWRQISKRLSFEGRQLFDEALASNRGVIILAPHLGNWEVLGLFLGSTGNLVGLFEPSRISSLGDIILGARQKTGGLFVPTTPRGIVKLVRNVRSGGLTGVLPDQVPDRESGGQNVSFMGVECATATLSSNLIKKSNAYVLFAASFRVPGGFHLIFEPAQQQVYSENLGDSLVAINKGIEALLCRCEAQYQWTYRRFRSRPRDLSNHYEGTLRGKS